MKTLKEIYSSYAGDSCLSGCDKGTIHSYMDVYEKIFDTYRNSARRVLEIGLMSGASLRMWEEYFLNPEVEVHGVDLCDRPHDGLADLRPLLAEGTHKISFVDATNLDQVESVFGQMRFDVVIDDASHAISHQLAIYNNFKDRLAPNAIYVIEDVENIDATRMLFEQIDPKKSVEIIDLRQVKGRFDDVLVVIR